MLNLTNSLILATLLTGLGSALNYARADPAADCIRFSAVKAWQVSFTLQGDVDGSPGPGTTMSSHETLAATSLVLDAKVAGSSCPADIQFKATSPSSEGITAVVNNKITAIDPGPPRCTMVTTQISAPGPVSFVEPPQLELQFSSGTYRLVFQAIAPVSQSVHGCGANLDVGGGIVMGPFGSNGFVPFIDKIALPASGLVLKGQTQLTETGNFSAGGDLPMKWTVVWNIVPIEDPEKKKETTPKSTKECGSIIGCENQSLGEAVRVAGTPFALHYQSDRATGRNLVNAVVVAHAHTFGGWTLNAHHRYDPATKTIFFGDGDFRDATDLGTVKPSAAGGFWIASADGGEVYEFAADGRHLKTLHGLTGAPLLRFNYGPQGELTDIIDANNNRTVIQRDASGRPAAIVAPYGQTTPLTLDANGHLASITDPAGAVHRFATSPEGLLLSYTNARNKTSRYVYDDQGRLTSDTNAAGVTSQQTLTRSETATAFRVALRTAEGRTTQYQTTPGDSGGEARTITNAAGLATHTSRGADGATTTATPDGMKSTQVLDADPRFGQSSTIIKRSTVATPGGIQFVSSAARSVVLANPADPFSLTTLTETATVNGRAFSRAYNGASRTLVDRTPAGRIRQTTIDAQGRVQSRAVTGLLPITYSYDSKGRLGGVTQGSGADARALKLTYDVNGHLETLTDPLGRTAGFASDAMGRVTQQTLTDGRIIRYAYDENGNLTELTPAGRPAHAFSYTNIDQTATYAAPALAGVASKTTYEYNLDRQLTLVTQPGGQTIGLKYDLAGRPQTMTITRGSYGFAYDATTGELSSITAPGGIGLAYSYDGSLVTASTLTGAVAGSVQRAYDHDFRVRELKVNGANAISFQFDQDGLLKNAGALALNRDAGNGLLAGTTLGAVTDSFAYDGFGALNQYAARFNTADVLKTQYTYDKLGRIVTRTETIAGATDTFAYAYDAAGRLSDVTVNGAVQSTYTYDSNGNRLTRVAGGATIAGTYDNQDRLTRYGTAIYTYSANGELTTKTDGRQHTNYTYDELGNLLSVTLPGGSTIDYLVDGSNRRVGRKVNGALGQGFLYESQLRPAAELDGTGNVVARFVYGLRLNVPEYMIKGGVTYRIVTDHLGSPRLVVNAATGAIAQRMDYDEFGKVIADTAAGFQPFGFAGGLYDRDTRLVRFGARDYDAETGRWTAKDPMSFSGGNANLYAYVGSNPLNGIDPFGLGKAYCRAYILPPFSTGDWADTIALGTAAGATVGAGITLWSGPGLMAGAGIGAFAGGTAVLVGYPVVQGLDWLLDYLNNSQSLPVCDVKC